MLNAKAITKYVRISPRKARLAANLIRGMGVGAAGVQLQMSGLKGGRLLKKTLDSAVANAEQLDKRAEDLSVLQVYVDEGPRLKRAKPKNRGGRHPICKRTSHFTVIVG
jgi:large subunit ribosomal protein L22